MPWSCQFQGTGFSMVLVPLGPVVRVHHVRGEGVRGGGRGQRRQRPRLRRYPG